MIYVTVIVIPLKLGGIGHIIDAAQAAYAARPPDAPKANVILGPTGYWAFSTLALGSALAGVTGRVCETRYGFVIIHLIIQC